MRKQPTPTDPPAAEPAVSPRARQMAPEESFDEEEKLIEGHHDVNMPSLLTRDVKGG